MQEEGLCFGAGSDPQGAQQPPPAQPRLPADRWLCGRNGKAICCAHRELCPSEPDLRPHRGKAPLCCCFTGAPAMHGLQWGILFVGTAGVTEIRK